MVQLEDGTSRPMTHAEKEQRRAAEVAARRANFEKNAKAGDRAQAALMDRKERMANERLRQAEKVRPYRSV